MLSYQHGYHAGNFADVIKHCALTCLLHYLIQKDKPLFYLETHAGKGLYALRDKQAQKTGEFKEGINLIWPDFHKLPPPFHTYIQAIKALNTNGQLMYYPGSPYLAAQILRREDRLHLCELHPQEFSELLQMPHPYKNIFFNHADGLASLKALLPPIEKRGLVFIDPSFELKDDYKKIPEYIHQVYKRFNHGVICLWYPIVNNRLCNQLKNGMIQIGAKKSLNIEFNLTLSRKEGMTGCGLWVINPTYPLAEEMKTILNTLRLYFYPGVSSYSIV